MLLQFHRKMCLFFRDGYCSIQGWYVMSRIYFKILQQRETTTIKMSVSSTPNLPPCRFLLSLPSIPSPTITDLSLIPFFFFCLFQDGLIQHKHLGLLSGPLLSNIIAFFCYTNENQYKTYFPLCLNGQKTSNQLQCYTVLINPRVREFTICSRWNGGPSR